MTIDGINYYNSAEIVTALSISRQTLWRWRTEGKVPVDRRYRDKTPLFTESELNKIERFANRIESLLEPKAQLELLN